MYSAKPIIHSVEAFNDPVKEAGAGISVEPENTSAIKDAILKMFSMSKNERNEMGERGKQFVVNHHSYSAIAHKYAEIL